MRPTSQSDKDLASTTKHFEVVKGGEAGEAFDERSMQALIPAVSITRSQWDHAYGEAYVLFRAGRYENALPILANLVRQTPMIAACHFMVAACLHRLASYPQAVQSYLAAYALDVDDPLPLFHCADCLYKLEKPHEAKASLERFIDSANPTKYGSQIKQAQVLINSHR